jgi:hypothetical protein
MQANAQYLIGLRTAPVDFGLVKVSSEDCADCHRRPTDRHPIYRFFEPRFAAARDAIAPQRCTSCHLEHTGRRITIENGFCSHCHDGLSIPNDRTQPTHEGIVQAEAWNTCLRCHDFHGNHEGETPSRIFDGISSEAIDRYFAGGASPFAPKRRHPIQERRSSQ